MKQASPTRLPDTCRHHMHCPAIGENFVIDIAVPKDSGVDPLPVIYLTDGNLMFPMVTSTLRLLQVGGELPPAILVGVGYTDDSQVMALRSRDLTPTFYAEYYEIAKLEGMPVPEHIRSGGADQFADFIDQQVKPFVQKHYNARTDDDTLVGNSLGGLFTLYNLFTRPHGYQRYVAGSPSLWWDNQVLFNTEAAFADNNKDLNARLFLSVGGLEEPANKPGQWAKMVTNMHTMADRLASRTYPSLRMHRHQFDNETHTSVVPATFSRGLREVFSE